MTKFNQYIEDQDNLELLDQQEIMAEWNKEINWDTALIGSDKSFVTKIDAKTNKVLEIEELHNASRHGKDTCKLNHLCDTCNHSDYCFGEFKYEQN